MISVLKFAFKNMAVKRAQIILIILSVVVSAGVAVLAFNTAEQVNDGITGTAGFYSAIIGPAGSKTQLAMNTMYFTDTPLGTVPYSLVTELRRDQRVSQVIPFAMADSYNGFNVVGTEGAFLSGKALSEGAMFDDNGLYQAVMGYNVARACGLKVGDVIYTSHAAGEEHKTPITVSGILGKTNTVYDNQVFTQLGTLWAVHEAEEEEEEEEHDHEEMNGMVCAVLVRTQNPAYAMTLVNDYNNRVWSYSEPSSARTKVPAHQLPGTEQNDTPAEDTQEHEADQVHENNESWSLQAIEPMDAVRGVLEDADNTRYIVFVLCGIILIMNIVIISVITLLNMYHSAEEISLMRLIGISMKKINLLYIIQNGMIGFVSIILAFAVSRLCLGVMSSYVESMGVVLDYGKVYPLEIVILLGVLLITVLPTVICTLVMSRKDGLNG